MAKTVKDLLAEANTTVPKLSPASMGRAALGRGDAGPLVLMSSFASPACTTRGILHRA